MFNLFDFENDLFTHAPPGSPRIVPIPSIYYFLATANSFQPSLQRRIDRVVNHGTQETR